MLPAAVIPQHRLPLILRVHLRTGDLVADLADLAEQLGAGAAVASEDFGVFGLGFGQRGVDVLFLVEPAAALDALEPAEVDVGGAGARAELAPPFHVHVGDLLDEAQVCGVFLRLLAVAFGLPFLLPFVLQPGELPGVDRVRPAAAVLAVLFGQVIAQDEGGEAVVVLAVRADDLAVVEERRLDPVERAVEHRVLQAQDAMALRGGPRGGEPGAIRVAAQLVGAAFGAADHAARRGDAAGIGQRLDKGTLDLGFPAVGSVLEARDGGEFNQRSGGFYRGLVAHPVSPGNYILYFTSP